MVTPSRGEIWKADLGEPRARHWVVIVSLDARNKNERHDSVLVVPFGSAGMEGPTTIALEPGETGLPATSYLKGHFSTTLKKSRLVERESRALSQSRMREVANMIRRAFDPDASWRQS
jgi:mRNA-degrading endonuclease toxin of MazEF toxin-antitoxin module